jgi:hypothetical protein
VVTSAGPCHQQPPGGPPSMPSTLVVAAIGPCCQHPQGGHHRRLQLWRWPLPDLPLGPLRGAVIDVSNISGGHCRTLLPSPPRRSTINVFNIRGGRCRICHQHPLGGPPSTSLTFEPLALAPPGGPPSIFLSVDGGRAQTSSSDTSRSPPSTAE